ncbi:MAG: Eco57I restriction-modification methylase domain-containing protein [Clostridiales bacterium]|nr:Eco57I restriction-modification methylase domain-containing protein [Clostridiales bacterium]
MASGGLRENAGRKKIGLVINTRIDEELINQIELYIQGLSRADKIRKCLLLGIEHNKSKSRNASSDSKINTISKFFRVYTKVLSLLNYTEDSNVKLLNSYLLGFFTNSIPTCLQLGISEETHKIIIGELERFSWSLNEYENQPNTITPSIIGSVIEKVVNQRDTGSYYTPKDTTNYITQYSIVFSLLCKCNSPSLAYHFYEQYNDTSNAGVLNDSSNPVEKLAVAINALDENDKNDIFRKILKFTVLDPTCGTGAFIIAAADILVQLYRLTNMYLYISLNDYVVNLFKNCLYGVDILDSAISLFHLRSKLYLYNLGISKKVVDNMEFQFYKGNSLSVLHSNKNDITDFFNWEKNFPAVFKNGGFDCIIGNPPYVETQKAKINLSQFGEYKTKTCGNLYAHIFENALSLLKDNSYMGMIVPISITATQRMEPLRRLLFDSCETIHIANFSDRPACLFTGVHQKLSIVFIKKTKPSNGCKVYTSTYNHWSKSERQNLFNSIKYFRTTKSFINTYGIAKVGDEIKQSIIKKVAENNISFNDILSDNKNNSIFFNQRMTFWAKCFTSPESSNEYKEYSIIDSVNKKAIAAIINSSLFYLLWETYSDCWHVTQNDLNNLRFSETFLEQRYQNILSELESKLEQRLYETREYIYSKQTDYIYVHRYCYNEITAINNIVAEIYGFTEEEKDYIQTYNEKYRLSVSSASEEE